MQPDKSQFPQSMGGFKFRGIELPATTNDFSDAALAGYKKTKVSSSVKVIEPRGGVIPPIPQKAYNQASTDLINMRKSGEAAKYDAETTKRRNEGSSWKPQKKTIKIDSGKAK